MKTNEIKFSDIKTAIDDILKESGKFCKYQELSEKDENRIHLLTEETITLMRSIVGDYEATLWFENDRKVSKICMSFPTNMNEEKREELLSISTSGKNAATKTLTGKIADMIEAGIERYETVDQLAMRYGGNFNEAGLAGGTAGNYSDYIYEWNLQTYMDENSAKDAAEKAEAEELSHSIIAKLADNVEVYIKRSGVRVVISYVAE